MQKYFKHILVLIFVVTSVSSRAQITILDQSMLTLQSFNTFTPVSITGTQTWNQSTSYGAVCTGYSMGQNYENEDWLVGPVMNLSQMDNVKLNFNHTRGTTAVMNFGVAEGWYKVFATADYTGNPSTTQWVELQGLNQAVPSGWQFIASGDLTIPAAARSANSRIAFRYISSATQSATWEIKNVKVTGEAQNSSAFKITNWNLEWLGCSTFGPTDENLQINNIASAMLAMNSDIYCVQEVSNTAANPSIETLLSLLGSENWGGFIVPGDTGDCVQRQAIIYKRSKVQLVGSGQFSNGNPSQGNNYFYNWSNGRYPTLYNVNLIAGSSLIPVSLVNIHAKSGSNDAENYIRRLGGSEGLKTILDGAAYNTKRVIIIGDFNDYLIGTSTSSACACTDSPFKNFMDDESDYIGITKDLVDLHHNGNNPVIENIIVSNELASNYLPGSVAQELSVAQGINNFYNTTSDHSPVSATFQFTTLHTEQYVQKQWKIAPNPVKNELTFDGNELTADVLITLFDLMGRQMSFDKINANTINVAHLPSGIYMLKAGDKRAKFVKE